MIGGAAQSNLLEEAASRQHQPMVPLCAWQNLHTVMFNYCKAVCIYNCHVAVWFKVSTQKFCRSWIVGLNLNTCL